MYPSTKFQTLDVFALQEHIQVGENNLLSLFLIVLKLSLVIFCKKIRNRKNHTDMSEI